MQISGRQRIVDLQSNAQPDDSMFNHRFVTVLQVDHLNNGALAVSDHPCTGKQIVDDAGGGITYQGFTTPGSATSAALWMIRRITIVGALTTIEHANGGTFDQVWDDRASLTYS